MLEGERWKLTRFYLDLTMVPTPSFLGGNFLTVMKYVCRLFFFAKKFKMKSFEKIFGGGGDSGWNGEFDFWARVGEFGR
jgi:hypothetical protein